MFISDGAIQNEKDDKLNRAGFAKKLGEQILNLANHEESKVIGIYGDWGKGKTSILNMATSHIEEISKKWKKAERPIIFRFNPWNFSEQERLLLAFFQQLFSTVNHRLPALKKDFQKSINGFAKALGAFESVPVAGIPLAATSKVINLIVPEESLEDLRIKIDEFFRELECKVVIIIDDVDRLTEKEIRQIFQLVKVNANFPNTIYLIAFDRNVVETALSTEQGISGRDYLKKIIQVGFDVPTIEQNRINSFLFSRLDEILSSVDTKYWNQTRWGNLYYAGLHKLFRSMRDVKRFLNSLSFNFQLVAGEINPIDFIGIEALRVFIPEIYKEIANNKDLFTSRIDSNNQNVLAEKKNHLDRIFESDSNQDEIAKNICIELFPLMRSTYPKFFMGTWNGNPASWRKERRICSDDVFDTYFVLGVPVGEVSKEELQQLVAIADQPDQVIILLRAYKEQGRIARLLDWLSDIIEELSKESVLGLCQALIEFGDELANIRRGVIGPGTDIQLPWLISQLLRRVEDPTLRFDWFLNQINNGKSFFTVIQQVSWNVPSQSDHVPNPLFNDQEVSVLTNSCVKKITEHAKNGSLLKTKNLAYILFRWKEWTKDEKTISSFIEETIESPSSALDFLTGFVWEASSYTFGDYVEKKELDIDAKSLKALANTEKLSKTLSSLLEQKETEISEMGQLAIELFFEKVVDKQDKR
jgi:predicted KAP-like P-loop ATPase